MRGNKRISTSEGVLYVRERLLDYYRRVCLRRKYMVVRNPSPNFESLFDLSILNGVSRFIKYKCNIVL